MSPASLITSGKIQACSWVRGRQIEEKEWNQNNRKYNVEAVAKEEQAEEEEHGDASVAFQFERQSQWIAVVYDNTYYLGQVLNIKFPDLAEVP